MMGLVGSKKPKTLTYVCNRCGATEKTDDMMQLLRRRCPCGGVKIEKSQTKP